MKLPKQRWFEQPDFRNLTIMAQLVALSLLLLFVLAEVSRFKFGGNYFGYLSITASWFLPAVLANLVLLVLSNNILYRIPGHLLLILLLVNAINILSYLLFSKPYSNPIIGTYIFLINIIYLLWARYHQLDKQCLSQAIVESKLMALTSTIHPHFLFNSINTAISLIRPQPATAEEVLQNLADLFRGILKKNNHSTLKEELELAQAYLEIEKLRLGPERLKVIWNIRAPYNAITPYLFLQPLLENAIYHGVEKLEIPEPIFIDIKRRRSWIYLQIKNPTQPALGTQIAHQHNGHKLTLTNLKERLMLMYSKDATLETVELEDYFVLRVRIPYYIHFHLPKM